jgi:transcriptional regulator with XRE-family HTH domain
VKPHPLIAQLTGIRRDQKISQGCIAQRIGRYPAEICRWERGAMPCLDMAIAYADAVGYALVLNIGCRCVHCGTGTAPAARAWVVDAESLISHLARVRRTANLSIRQAAELARISQRTITGWDTRAHLPRLDVLTYYMTALGCSLTLEPIPAEVAS